jgi:hypothetical protein
MAKDLLPDRGGEGPHAEARRITWAMSDLLPWHVAHPRACRRVFRDRAAFAAEWAAQGGDPARMPEVDFARSMVVAVIEAEGQYTESHNVERVALTQIGEVIVVVGVSARPWKMTNPASVIRVDRVDGDVRFIDASSPEAAALS